MRVIPHSRPLLAALLALVVLLGLASVATSSRPAGAAAVARYDGDALLRGMFFALGPVAQRYPKLVLSDVVEPERNADLVPRLFAQAERTDPGFRDRFAAAMYSRDRLRIQRSAVDTSNTLEAALWVLYPDAAGDWTSGGGTVTAVYQFVDNDVFLDVVLEVLDFGIVLAVGPGGPDDLTLRLEQWAQRVATTLTGA